MHILRILASILVSAGALMAATPVLPPVQEGAIAQRTKGSIPGVGYGFLEYVPAGHAAHPQRRYPLLIQLGGRGERGNGTTQLVRMEQNGALKLIRSGSSVVDFSDHAADTACVIFAPQIATDQTYIGSVLDALKGIADLIVAQRRIDTARIYVTGLSLGGEGAWDYGQRIGGVTALVPCATGEGAAAHKKFFNFAQTAIWGFHNYGDTTTGLGAHEAWFDFTTTYLAGMTVPKVHASYPGGGGQADRTYTAHWNPTALWTWSHVATGVHTPGVGVPVGHSADRLRLTVFRGSAHEGWTAAYNNPDLWRWMFQQRRNSPPTVEAGSARTVAVTGPVWLDATVSDPDPGTPTATWAKASGPGTVTFADVHAVDASVRFGALGTYVLSLTASDGIATAQDTVAITVVASSAVPELIIDNTDTGATAQVGTWTLSTGVPGYYGANAAFANPAGQGGRSFSYLPTFPQAGPYLVSIYFPAKYTRDAAVPVDIDHAGGRTTILLNQQINGGRWLALGSFDFAAGRSTAITIRTDGTTGYVVADAVGFSYLGEPQAPQAAN